MTGCPHLRETSRLIFGLGHNNSKGGLYHRWREGIDGYVNLFRVIRLAADVRESYLYLDMDSDSKS